MAFRSLTFLGFFVVLAASASAIEDEPEVTLPLPPGTVFYVRYGEPGGVRLLDQFDRPDSLGLTVGPTAMPRGDQIAGEEASLDRQELAEMLRALIREELRAMGRVLDAPAPIASTEIRRPRRAGSVIDAGTTTPVDPVQVVTNEAASDKTKDDEPPAQAPQIIERVAAPVQPKVVREQILNDGLFRTSAILFETSKDQLLSSSRDALLTIGGVLAEFPEARISIEGHADHRGSEEFNLELSRRRAETVRDYLIECCALSSSQLETVGFGESRPLVTGDSPTQLALNRRVEFRVLNPDALKVTPDAQDER